MTNTLPSTNGSKPRRKRSGPESAVGLQKHKRTATYVGLALVTPLLGQEFLDSTACAIRSTAACATASRRRSRRWEHPPASSSGSRASASPPPA